MNGELWKLKDEKKDPLLNRKRLFALGGIIGMLLACGVAYYSLSTRAKPPVDQAHVIDPGKPRGLGIFDGKTTFAVDPIQTIELRLPCSGLLTISLTCPDGALVNAFLVTAEERQKMEARETFAHVEGFDGRTGSGTYQQAKELSPGRYTLVLLDENRSRSVVSVKARLTDLK